jgi:hypothetical protein
LGEAGRFVAAAMRVMRAILKSPIEEPCSARQNTLMPLLNGDMGQ